MKKKQLAFLKELMNTICPSGFEEGAARIWQKEAKTFADEVYGDVHGNSYAVINPKGSPRVMLAGHIDEIGLMVTHIDKDGFIYFTGIGGWDLQVLVGQRIIIKTKDALVYGVIGKKPPHLMTPDERKKVAKFKELWIDIGAKNKKEASSLVALGDPAVINYGFQELLNNLVAARAFDDRVGSFVVLEALRIISKMKPKAAVYAVATSQEEVGCRGAITSTFGINPEVGIAVDVGFATDTPGLGSVKMEMGEAKMGKGPIITRGSNINPILFNILTTIAKKQKIPYQIQVAPGHTGTDAWVIQVARSGVATALISIPNRYMHSPCEIVNLNDLDNTSKLIAFTIKDINHKTNFKPV